MASYLWHLNIGVLVFCSYLEGFEFKSYCRSPKVDILTSESTRNLDAPLVASFSSRGPNTVIPDILKVQIACTLFMYVFKLSIEQLQANKICCDNAIQYTYIYIYICSQM